MSKTTNNSKMAKENSKGTTKSTKLDLYFNGKAKMNKIIANLERKAEKYSNYSQEVEA
jgi:hypothetical protein